MSPIDTFKEWRDLHKSYDSAMSLVQKSTEQCKIKVYKKKREGAGKWTDGGIFKATNIFLTYLQVEKVEGEISSLRA